MPFNRSVICLTAKNFKILKFKIFVCISLKFPLTWKSVFLRTKETILVYESLNFDGHFDTSYVLQNPLEVTAPKCYSTKVLQYQAVTVPKSYSTEVLQYQSVTLPKCYSTDVLMLWWQENSLFITTFIGSYSLASH